MHYTRIWIENFRGLSHLAIEDLGRINLLVGPNNSGKTSVLEALWLLQAPGSPSLTSNLSVFRGLNAGPQAADPGWSTLFADLDRSKVIRIGGEYSGGASEELTISLTSRWPDGIKHGVATTPTPNSELSASTSAFPETLEYAYSTDGRLIGKASLAIGLGRLVLDANPALPLRDAVFLSSRQRGSPETLAARFTRTQDSGGIESLVADLAVLEPGIQDLSLGYRPLDAQPPVQLRAHIAGLPTPLPIQLLGDGVGRLIEILLAFSETAGGLLLVDEIENGLYYQNLESAWKAIAASAVSHDTQLIAATHSAECVGAAVKAFHGMRAEEFRLFRLERTIEGTRVTAYDHATAEAALDFELEFR
jgi:hypothetical protein